MFIKQLGLLLFVATVANARLRTGEQFTAVLNTVSNADEGDYPWFVSWGECSGSLIAPQLVLTAARCSLNTWQPDYVILGQYDMNDPSGTTVVDIVDSVVHPKFNQDVSLSANDFMLLKLANPVAYTSLPNSFNGTVGFGIAFAAIGHQLTDDTSTILQEVRVDRISYDYCQKTESETDMDDIHFCATTAADEEGIGQSCRGDPGGPIIRKIAQSNQLSFLVGVFFGMQERKIRFVRSHLCSRHVDWRGIVPTLGGTRRTHWSGIPWILIKSSCGNIVRCVWMEAKAH